MTMKRDSPFASLEALRGQLPKGTAPESNREPKPDQKQGPARAVVRLERKQRRGKEVTVVDKLELSDDELARWCRELKQALGCGGAVEDRTIVLQGDLRQRLPELLTARGVRKLTVA